MWRQNDLTEATGGAPLAIGDPAGYTWDGTRASTSIYRAPPHIHELFFQFSTGVWVQNDLTEATGGAPLALGDPAGYTWDVDLSQHVDYRDRPHIQELFFQSLRRRVGR